MKYFFDTKTQKLTDGISDTVYDYDILDEVVGNEIWIVKYVLEDDIEVPKPVLCKTTKTRGHPTKDWVDNRSIISKKYREKIENLSHQVIEIKSLVTPVRNVGIKPNKKVKENFCVESNPNTSNVVKSLVLPYFAAAIKQTFAIAKKINDFEKSLGFEKSKKIESEWLSYNFAYQIKHYLEQIEEIKNKIEISVGKSDNDVDIYFSLIADPDIDYPLEIKVTCSQNWRGGEFSKRQSDHIMLYWNEKEDMSVEVYACVVYLSKDDWVSQMQKGKRYYAPNIYRYTLAVKEERADILGSITGYFKNGSRNTVKINTLDI